MKNTQRSLLTLTAATLVLILSQANAGYNNVPSYSYSETISNSENSEVQLKKCQKTIEAELTKVKSAGGRVLNVNNCKVYRSEYGEFRDAETSVNGGFSFL